MINERVNFDRFIYTNFITFFTDVFDLDFKC